MVLGPFQGCVQTGISPCSVMNIFVMTNRIANEKIEMCCYANLSNYEARQRTRDTRPLDNSCTCCLCVKLGFVYHPLLMYCELRRVYGINPFITLNCNLTNKGLKPIRNIKNLDGIIKQTLFNNEN